MCGEKILAEFQIDHSTPLHHGGAHHPNNWMVVHVECHKAKTKLDVKASAKIKRIIKADTEPKKPSRLQSRGFDKALSRGFDGKVRKRKSLQDD
jgi:5-methylcytosine-specific restriction endonuclease McrA